MPTNAAIVVLNLLLQQSPATPTFQSTTRTVSLNVIAVDKAGRPVDGLTRDDFTITDNGHSRAITHFALQMSADTSQAGPAPRELPANTYSNKASRDTAAVTVILFDGLNTPADQQAVAKLKVIAYLRNINRASPIAIYYLGNTLTLIHDFTEDRQSLVDALNRKGARPNTEVADSSPEPANVGADPLFNAAIDRFNAVIAERAVTERAIGTAQALRAIQAHISRVPGRKNLIWLAGSFPAGASGFSDTAVYPVSTMGLETGILPIEGRPGKADPNLGATAIYRTPVEPFREFANALAADTGGRTFYGVNNFGAAIQSAIDDSRVTYSIAFSPPVESLDSRNHALKITVNRPGVYLRYRSKYLASSTTTQPSLEEAIRSRDSIPTIGLDVEMKAKVDGLTAFIRVDPQDIAFTERDGKWEASLMTVVGPADKTAPVTPVHISLTPESYNDVRKRGFELVQHLPPASNGSEYLVAVQDSVSGQIGTLRFVR